jgi:hypothetical protein
MNQNAAMRIMRIIGCVILVSRPRLILSSSELDVGVIADASPSLRTTVPVDTMRLRVFVTSQLTTTNIALN